MSHVFDYIPLPKKITVKGKETTFTCWSPHVPIVICSVKTHMMSGYIQAIVDSGADRNVFPAVIAENVGLKVKKGKKRPTIGVGGKRFDCYSHEFYIHINGVKIKAEIDFHYEPQQTPILGRKGFFNHFKTVTFNEKDRTVTLEEKS